jgi:outer membrane receptor protein involved in Fe transport
LGHGTEDQAQVLATSNPNLVPSTAETWTAGLVYSPSYIPGMTLTFDYFRALQQGIVGTLGGQVILSSVDKLGTASPFASQVAFNAFPGTPGAVPVTGAGQLTGNLQSVFYLDPLLNLGAYRVEGFDMSLRYLMELHNWGQLELGIASVVYNHQDSKRFGNSNYYNSGDQIGSEFQGATPDYRITMLAEYRVWGFTLSLNGNYIPSMRDIVGVDPETVDQHNLPLVEDYFVMDGRLSYEFHRTPEPPPTAPMGKDAKDGKAVVAGAPTGPCGGTWSGWGDRMLDGLTLTVGCNNLLDEDPRFVPGANSATNLATYDPYGRFVYFEVSHKF